MFGLFYLILIFVFPFWKSKDSDEAEEYDLDYIPRMPTKYSIEDLHAIIGNFKKKLSEGGFGTIFEGILIDGTKVVVK